MSPAAEFRKDSNHLDSTISTSDNIKIFLPGSCVLKRLCTVKSTSETHFKTIIFTHLGSSQDRVGRAGFIIMQFKG